MFLLMTLVLAPIGDVILSLVPDKTDIKINGGAAGAGVDLQTLGR